jgi:hypothetical protein
MTNIPNLDLHGVKHEDVTPIVEDWALLWSYRVPAFTGKIITGNSSKMRVLVEGVLMKHKFEYTYMNDGSIIVAGKI